MTKQRRTIQLEKCSDERPSPFFLLNEGLWGEESLDGRVVLVAVFMPGKFVVATDKINMIWGSSADKYFLKAGRQDSL